MGIFQALWLGFLSIYVLAYAYARWFKEPEYDSWPHLNRGRWRER